MTIDQIPDFKQFPKIRAQLNSFGYSKVFNEGDVIINEHAFIKAIPIILSGSIKVMRSDDDGRELLLYYLQPGESCIMSFLSGLHNNTSKIKAVAEENTEIFFIPNEKVPQLIKEYPEWLDYIFKLYHKRFEELLEVVNGVAFKKMDQRLWEFLAKKAEITHSKDLQITHEQLANELGTVRVVISRLLKQLEIEGRITLGRNKITLL